MQIPFQVFTTDTIDSSNGIKVMVYSRSGIGKTTLISTAPTPFVMSGENGLLSLRKFKIPATNVTTLNQLDQIYTWFINRGDNGYFRTLCLDSITEVSEQVLATELRKEKDPRKAYGTLASEINHRFRAFRDMPQRNVYFIAQQDRVKNEVTGAVSFGPAFPGQQLDQKTPYFFDETFQLVVDNNGNRWLRTQPDPQNEAKDRSGRLAPWEPADLTHVFNKIMS